MTCCCGGTMVCTGAFMGLVGVWPRAFNSLDSWQSAQVRQKKCVQQSPHGSAFKLYFARIAAREGKERHDATQQHKPWSQKKAQQSGKKCPGPPMASLFFPKRMEGMKYPMQHDSHSSKHPQMPLLHGWGSPCMAAMAPL